MKKLFFYRLGQKGREGSRGLGIVCISFRVSWFGGRGLAETRLFAKRISPLWEVKFGIIPSFFLLELFVLFCFVCGL